MAAEPGFEDSRLLGPVSTSSNHAVTSGDNWGLFSTSSNHADSKPAANWGLVSTSSKPAGCTQDVVLSSTAPRFEDSEGQYKRRVPRTDPEYYWKCCCEEIVSAQRTLGFPKLNQLFAELLASANVAFTAGHKHSFLHYNHLLLQLFAAANLQIASDSAYAKTLSMYSLRQASLCRATKQLMPMYWKTAGNLFQGI